MDKKERNKIALAKYSQTDKGKEAKKKANKKYRESKNGIENRNIWRGNNHDKEKISIWKSRGIITNDFNNVYDVYINTTNCDYCNKKFKNTLDRCLDHDHSIKDNNNIRGIICRPCNTSDVLAGYPTIF